MLRQETIDESVLAIFDMGGWILPETYIKSLSIVLRFAKVTDEELGKVVFEQLLEMEKSQGKEFHSTRNYPQTGDWLKWLGRKPKTKDERAEEQAELVFLEMPKLLWSNRVLFEDPITNHVINNRMGGLSDFRWQFNPENEYRRNPKTLKEEFKAAYLFAYEHSLKQFTPINLAGVPRISEEKIRMVDNVQKCEALLEHSEKQKNLKPLEIVSKTTKALSA